MLSIDSSHGERLFFSLSICSTPVIKPCVQCEEKTIIAPPASVAQLDACPTCDQEFAGSTPAGSATFFSRVEMIMQYFLQSFSPTDSRRAVVSFW